MIQALHWDRGRLARREREAGAVGWQLGRFEISAPDGARCGRDARGPSEELEWSREMCTQAAILRVRRKRYFCIMPIR